MIYKAFDSIKDRSSVLSSAERLFAAGAHVRVCVHRVDAEGYPEENQRAKEQA